MGNGEEGRKYKALMGNKGSGIKGPYVVAILNQGWTYLLTVKI